MKIIPTPKLISWSLEEGQKVSFAPSVQANTEFSNAICVFASYAKKIYGVDIQITEQGSIHVEKDAQMEQEAYKIQVNADGITIFASEAAGVNHAFATLLQMMEVNDGKMNVPGICVEDKPDMQYRGMSVDLARSWHPFSFLLSYVDMCYFYKVAVLQLHFTDDESYTLPSELFPKLSSKDSHYTKAEIQELVEYAEERGVQLMPEIDVPGHCASFQEAYSEIFGTKGVICQSEEAIAAMKSLFAELCDMFPYSKYIHIGGDEVFQIVEWSRCPKCIEYAESLGINKDVVGEEMFCQLLYANFITEMANACFEKGRQPIVWEGFSAKVNDKISRDILVMAWESYYQLAPELLEAGFKVINCSWNPMYVVVPERAWPTEEMYQWSICQWQGIHPDSPYLKEPHCVPEHPAIIGGQILAWGDFIVTRFDPIIEGIKEEKLRLMERLPVLSERTWNVQKRKEYQDFQAVVDVLHEKIMRV